MGHGTCCVVNCKNTGVNNKNVKFYKFPVAKHKLIQRQKWIAAVKRVNPDGSPWIPKPSSTICSAHFVQNAKSENIFSPSYVPTIFPSIYNKKVKNQTAAVNRHERFMKRRSLKQSLTRKIIVEKFEIICKKEDLGICSDIEVSPTVCEKILYCDQESEAFFAIESDKTSRTFVCNRYTYKDGACVTCEVEIQTDIILKYQT